MADSAPPARRSGRPQRKRMYIDTYEQLGRDEEKQLSEALKASLEANSTAEEPVKPVTKPVKPTTKPSLKRGRGRPKSQKTLAKEKNEEAQAAETATDKQPDPDNDSQKSDEPKSKKKKTIIRNKTASEGVPIKAQRKFAAVTANGKRNPSKRKPTPKQVPKQAPTLPPSEECDDDGSKTEEFVDYLCLRKSVPTKSEWRSFSGEDEDSLVIAESEESACEDGEDFKVFDFDEPTTEHDSDKKTDKTKQPIVKKPHNSPSKKRKLTQNYYNAKLRSSFDNTDNSALDSAPIFRPTGEEFKNFHAYLEKITAQLLSAGMCKVVPPLAWKTPHVLQDDLRFHMRKQEVHRMCHRSGPSTNVLKQIKAHLIHDHGFEWKGLPQIGSTVVDLTRFSWLMRKQGGLQVVIDKNRWAKIGDLLGIAHVAERSEQLEDIYCTYLLSFDLLSDEEKVRLKVDDIDIDDIEESGKKISLQALRRHDTHARKTKFPPDGTASPTSLELEFWNLVCSAEEYFAASKGQESTITHGSGFPAYEPRHIAQSDWNLTNLRHLPDGVMGFLPNVKFVTQPRLELCSLYSAAGWHVEPHFLPLISYNHFNHPRIWYTCPAADSRRFLSALHDIVPRLSSGKHILDPNCVLVPPAELTAKDIKIVRAVQKPGEFIITAPKAYISHLSLGLNVNEAVNFATEDWLHYCSDSLQLYQDWNLKPPLNIPQIVIDVIKRHDSLNERALRDAEPFLVSLLNDELEARQSCTLPTASIIQDNGTNKYCEACQTICHLSYVRPASSAVQPSTKLKEKKSKSLMKEQRVYCVRHAGHVTVGMLECKIPDAAIKRLLGTLEKRLHPKQVIVHPVQSLPRSVSRPQTTPPTPTSERAPGSPSERGPGSPSVCPPSPEETAVDDASLVLPYIPPPPQTPVTPLPKLIPIKPAPLRPCSGPAPLRTPPIIPSLLVHPQQFAFSLGLPHRSYTEPQQRPALWESYQPPPGGT